MSTFNVDRANLIDAALATSLTNSGHDLLDMMSNDTMWTKIKEKIKAKIESQRKKLAKLKKTLSALFSPKIEQFGKTTSCGLSSKI